MGWTRAEAQRTDGPPTDPTRPPMTVYPLAQKSGPILHARAWAERVRSTGAAASTGPSILCVELRDRSHGRDALTPARIASIWEALSAQFGGSAGIGLLGEERALLANVDEYRWTAVVASIFETMTRTESSGSYLEIGVGVAHPDGADHTTSDVIRLAVDGAREALSTGVGLVVQSASRESREDRKGRIERSLASALDGARDGMRIILQPNVDAWTQEIVGAEALLRFRCPELGNVSVVELLAAAARTGELERVDRWVLGLTAEQQSRLAREGERPLSVSVNVRWETIASPTFPEFMWGLLTEYGIGAELLSIEIREAEAIERAAELTRPLAALHQMGVKVTLDDFGAATDAVADLGRLSVEAVKLDRRLVRDVVLDPESRSRATALLRLARALGLTTAAVGIETTAQAELLRGAGCEILQGFRFHRPMEVDALHAAMRSAPVLLAA